MHAVQRPVHMELEPPSHIAGPLNGNPYATVDHAMKMKCRASEEQNGRDSDYPGEKKMAKYNGDNLVFQFPRVIGEKQMRAENRNEAMNELLGNLGVDSKSITAVTQNDKEVTVRITSSGGNVAKNPKPPQRESSFKATKRLSGKGVRTGTAQQLPTKPSPSTSPSSPIEVPMVQTAPDGDQNVYYASHYAASQPGKVKAKLHIDPQSMGHVSPTASPELISNRRLLLDVIEGEDSDEKEFAAESSALRNDCTDSESEEEITYHDSPTLPRRGNVAAKVQFLSKTMAFLPPKESPETNKHKNTSVPMIGLTHLAATEVSDRIAKHNEKSLAAGQVMSTANMVLYSSKQPPKKVVEYHPNQHHDTNEQEEDFRSASVLRHRQEGWNKVEINESDSSDVISDHVEEEEEEEQEDFPPPPPPLPTPPVVKTIRLGEEAEFRLNIQVSDTGKHIPSPTSSDGHVDSGYEDVATSTPVAVHHIKVVEPAVQKLSVHVEESVSEDLLNELFMNGNEDDHAVTVEQKEKERTSNDKVTVVIKRPDSEEQRHADEDESGGYARIEDITPGKGQEDTELNYVKENGMTDEEFLNSYTIIPTKDAVQEMVVQEDIQEVEPKHTKKVKQSPEERGPAILNELINGIRTMKQEMSYKAKEQSELESAVFPTSPVSDKSNSPTMPLSPTSTLSRGKRRRRKTSDKGYSSTNSSLSESGKNYSIVRSSNSTNFL